MVHCTGCPLVRLCPAKTILGDYGKEKEHTADLADDQSSKCNAQSGKADQTENFN